jgi:hypothetical protein
MTVIELRQLSLADAEEVIAEVWNCLEEYDIATPRIGVEFHSAAKVSLCFRIEESISEKVLALRLSSWRCANDPAIEARASNSKSDVRGYA